MKILDSKPSDPSQALLLRSLCSERTGRPYEAVADAERALEEKETSQTHSRTAFAHLGVALQHLKRVQQLQPRKDLAPTRRLVETIQHELSQVNFGNPFDRLSSHLLLKVFTFCDAASLLKSQRVSKMWNDVISGSSELFRRFEMEGTVGHIAKGLKLFSRRCKSTMKRVVIRLEDKAGEIGYDNLKSTISKNFQTLKSLSVGHQGDLSEMMESFAKKSGKLSVLECYQMGFEEVMLKPDREETSFQLPSSDILLQSLIWNCGAQNLICDEALLNRLQGATTINISSSLLTPSWTVELLASNPHLEDVRLRWSRNPAVTDGFPEMSLPFLKVLFLGVIPRGPSKLDSSLFFANLNTPKLNLLHLIEASPQDLKSFRTESSPHHFIINELLSVDPFNLIDAIKDWKISRLHLRLPLYTSAVFWTKLLHLLTPLSSLSIDSGYEDRILLPRLVDLQLGSEVAQSTSSDIDMEDLGSMVLARVAAHNGRSSENVSKIAGGHTHGFSGLAFFESEKPAFGTLEPCSIIQKLAVFIPITNDSDDSDRLLWQNLPRLKLGREEYIEGILQVQSIESDGKFNGLHSDLI